MDVVIIYGSNGGSLLQSHLFKVDHFVSLQTWRCLFKCMQRVMLANVEMQARAVVTGLAPPGDVIKMF